MSYVEEQTQSGYSTPSEYVRELIREDQNAAPNRGLMLFCSKD
jgi:Arc/MetJ-type ribon-helix-helix transcriptional regulator